MLIIRLARIGRKNDSAFRVVVTEHTRGPKSGKHLEILGNYNPKMDDVSIDGERVKYYISNGAQVSDTVHNILVGQGIIEGKKINVLPKKSPIVKDDSSEGIAPKGVKQETTESEESKEETPKEADEVKKETPKDETATKEVKEEVKDEASSEEAKDEEITSEVLETKKENEAPKEA